MADVFKPGNLFETSEDLAALELKSYAQPTPNIISMVFNDGLYVTIDRGGLSAEEIQQIRSLAGQVLEEYHAFAEGCIQQGKTHNRVNELLSEEPADSAFEQKLAELNRQGVRIVSKTGLKGFSILNLLNYIKSERGLRKNRST